ncbi:uncharacterized protein LOC135390623 [Ornithodoros turicata]|uniref:uncharacterized protein LOC135390623 n=1 Tax=Ornithodoros turicata TaxID=34597 RepID=UPI0031387552
MAPSTGSQIVWRFPQIFTLLSVILSLHVGFARYGERCRIPETLQGEWYSKEYGDDTNTVIEETSVNNRGTCLSLLNTANDNFTIVFKQPNKQCYYCIRFFVRTLNVLEKIETGCVNLNEGEVPNRETVCRTLDTAQELITLFSVNPTSKNCRSSLEGVWKFAYRNSYKFTGECKHPEANITACQRPGTQFFLVNQQLTINYRKCEGMEETEDGEVQFKCLGDWYIGKNHYFAVMNARESRIDEKYRCFLANRDDDLFIGVSITPECSILKTPQESPERYRLEQVKTEVVLPRCQFPDNFTGTWLNTANFDSEVIINKTHIVERWKPDTGRFKEQIYVCIERRQNRVLMARHGIHGCQRDYVCFDFVPRHQSVIRYRKGKEMIVGEFSTVCSWTMFPGKERWRYDILISQDPVTIKCPVAGKFRFEQRGDIPFETRIRGGVTQIPRPNVYCKENISDFSVCDPDQRIISIDADYCISVDYFGRPIDIYSEPDYQMKCIAFWKENLRSYLITYDELDAYSKFRCWVYQRADLNRVLMSQSVGAFCHVRQDVDSYNFSEGAQVALDMVEYEREHDDCPMYFDDGSNPWSFTAEQAAILTSGSIVVTVTQYMPLILCLMVAVFNCVLCSRS